MGNPRPVKRPAAPPARVQGGAERRPSLCRMVVYRLASYEGDPNRPGTINGVALHVAVVTGLAPDGTVNLKVLPDMAPIFDVRGVAHGCDAPGCWLWPDQIPDPK